MKKIVKPLSRTAKKILMASAEQKAVALWEQHVCSHGPGGIWVRHEDVPPVDAGELLDSGLIEDEKRIAKLEKGGKPTAAEIKAYQQWWAESQLEGDADADLIPGYALAPVKDDDGHEGIALILRTGCSFSEINTWLEGIFASNEEAVAWMKKRGWCS